MSGIRWNAVANSETEIGKLGEFFSVKIKRSSREWWRFEWMCEGILFASGGGNTKEICKQRAVEYMRRETEPLFKAA